MRQMKSTEDVVSFLAPYVAIKPNRGPYKLDTMRRLMEILDSPQDKVRVIHVAGTSGKTSTSYYLASLLTAAGHSVGLSVSPHIMSVRERTQINMKLIDEAEYCQLFESFMEIVLKTPLKPSYFELLVAFSYWVFARRNLEFAVMEVGLGGLLDGTNVVSRGDKVCVITDIGLDHQEILGETLPEIAYQKAGIILPNNQVFVHNQGTEVMAVIEKSANTAGGHLHIVDKKATPSQKGLSKFQQRNFSLAVATINETIGELEQGVIEKASRTVVPARMEQLLDDHNLPVIIDGSHNQQKIQTLVDSFKASFPDVRPVLVVSFGNNRHQAMQQGLEVLHEISDTIVITSFDVTADRRQQALPTDEIAQEAKRQGFTNIYEEPIPKEALEKARSLTSGHILVTGSLYLAVSVRPLLVTN